MRIIIICRTLAFAGILVIAAHGESPDDGAILKLDSIEVKNYSNGTQVAGIIRNISPFPVKAFRTRVVKKNDFGEESTVCALQVTSDTVLGTNGKPLVNHVIQMGESVGFLFLDLDRGKEVYFTSNPPRTEMHDIGPYRLEIDAVVLDESVFGRNGPSTKGDAATKSRADLRVQRALDASGLHYSISKNGDFQVVRKLDDRTQLVVIFSSTEQMNSMEIREVVSLAYVSDGVMPEATAKDLLKENRRFILGAWELGVHYGKESAIFTAKIGASANADTLLEAIAAVAIVADRKEKELLKTDDL